MKQVKDKEGIRLNMEKENKNNKDEIHEVGEDATKYGEFISSYFAWIPLPKQKERAKELDEMTKNNKE